MKIRALVTLLLLGAVPALRAAPASVSVEDRLAALERQVQSLEQENTDLKARLGWKGTTPPVLPQPGGTESKLVVGGFLQGQGEFGRAPDSRWAGVRDRLFFRRARLYLAGVLPADFDFKAELDLQGNTLGAGTGQLARANEIFVNWHRFPAANLRFGQLKPAYGAEALLSDTKMLTIERALTSDRLTDSRQLAMSVGGDLVDKRLNYLVVVANGNGPNVSANDNSSFQRSARLVWTPVADAANKLVLGVDGLWSKDTALAKSDFGFTGNLFTGERDMAGADVAWNHGPFDFTAEWLQGTFKPVTAVPARSVEAQGWQATAAYYLLPGRLQAVVREEEFDPNTAVAGNTVRTLGLGLNFYLKGDDVKLMLQYLHADNPALVGSGDRLLTRVQVMY